MPESLIIQIPGDTDPMDRHDIYEKPINKALRNAGRLGRTTGGGTGMTINLRGASVECCYIDVEVTDLRKAFPAIRAALVKAKVPAGTLVGHYESDSILLDFTASGPVVVTPVNRPLAPPKPRVPWSACDVVGYRLTADRWVLLHVEGVDAQAVALRVPEWCGRELPAASKIPDLLRRPPTKYRLCGTFLFSTSRLGVMGVRRTRTRAVDVRRTVRTGITAKPPKTRSGDGLNVTNPEHFNRTLAEVFGLIPVDGATRLSNDLGIGPMHLHLAAWDAGRTGVTAARAKELFYAHVGSNPVKDQPLRGTVRPTAKTRRFVQELKSQFKQDDVWGWGSFRAREGFVIIPIDGDRFADVWPVAVRLGSEVGVTVFDPQANHVVHPQGV